MMFNSALRLKHGRLATRFWPRVILGASASWGIGELEPLGYEHADGVWIVQPLAAEAC